ncbi:MAG: hypothetical protein ACJAYR_000266 [Sneathiella sp.]
MLKTGVFAVNIPANLRKTDKDAVLGAFFAAGFSPSARHPISLRSGKKDADGRAGYEFLSITFSILEVMNNI